MFEQELQNWGPDRLAERNVSLADAEAYCRNLAQNHYENFPVVSWLLPRSLHQHFYNVYAFCRWADDLSDEVIGTEASLKLLAWWREQLASCYKGKAEHPVFVALGKTIEECHIPAEPFENLISAFEQDQRITDYSTFSELLDYCRRSANPVGVLVLYVCGCHTERNVGWSDSICTGLQLANFWQDVSRDFDRGRIYLPREDRDRFGYSSADLQARTMNSEFLSLMQFEVDRAREFLLAGLPLVEHLPGRLKIDIELFVRGGLIILKRIEAIDYGVWEERPVVSKRDFASLTIGCIGRALARRFRWNRSRTANDLPPNNPKTIP